MTDVKRVLAVGFSQTGQLSRLLDAVLAPLQDSAAIAVTRISLQPLTPFPFPWPFWRFFDTFPESVYGEPAPIDESQIPEGDFDLIVLAYQVWFLSPAMPAMAFLQSARGRRLLAGKPVVTLIGCRNMWLMAQERMKTELQALGARLVDNIVLTDSAHAAFTFISTPAWMLTGNKGPFLGGLIPAAGISDAEIAEARRFGIAMAQALPTRDASDDSPMCRGLGAVSINERLIASERVVHRSFRLWGALLRKLGRPGAPLRRATLVLYVLFLVTMILTVVPISAVIKRLVAPFTRDHIARQRAYYAAPSGESLEVGS